MPFKVSAHSTADISPAVCADVSPFLQATVPLPLPTGQRLPLACGCRKRKGKQTCIAAQSKGVQPPKGELSRSCRFAPFSSRSSTMSLLPLQAAHCRGVSARLLGAFGSAPAASKLFAACTATAPDLNCAGATVQWYKHCRCGVVRCFLRHMPQLHVHSIFSVCSMRSHRVSHTTIFSQWKGHHVLIIASLLCNKFIPRCGLHRLPAAEMSLPPGQSC